MEGCDGVEGKAECRKGGGRGAKLAKEEEKKRKRATKEKAI